MIKSAKVAAGQSSGTSRASLFRYEACYWWSRCGKANLQICKANWETLKEKKKHSVPLFALLLVTRQILLVIYLFVPFSLPINLEQPKQVGNLCPPICLILSMNPRGLGEVKSSRQQ